MLGSIDREKLRTLFSIPDSIDVLLLVALGYPKLKPIIDTVKAGDIKYWLDEAGDLHVPKRSLDDILSWNTYK